MKKKRVNTTNFRLQAQILTLPRTSILWINSYLPTDPGTIDFNDEELLSVLHEIESILDKEEWDDVVWQGDLNWHRGRNTGFAHTMERFITRLGLVSTWDHFECDYTHIHTDLKSVSTLDHFIVSPRLINQIEGCGPMHLGDNRSRHSPIMLKLRVGDIPRSTPVQVDRPRRPVWYKATEAHCNRFTHKLHDRVSQLNINKPDCLNCTDVHCQDNSHSVERDNYVLQ